jgi:hypothetical protein
LLGFLGNDCGEVVTPPCPSKEAKRYIIGYDC